MVSVGDEMANVRSGERFVWRATRFTTVSGHLTLRQGAEERLLGPADEGIIPAGTAHRWGNATYRREFDFATDGQHRVLSPLMAASAVLGRRLGLRSGYPHPDDSRP